MSERAGTEAGYEEAGRSKEREARERRTDIALYSQDTERQTQKTRTKTQLASFLRHSTLSLSHTRYSDSPLPLQKRAIPRRAARSTTNSTSRHILLCVCVLSPHLLLSHPIQPCHAYKKKHMRAHVAIGILHPPPAHAATSKGNEEAHQARYSKALQRPPFPHRGPHSTRCSRVHSPSLRAPQTRYAPGPGVCAARWSRRSASKRSSSPKDRDGYEHLLSSTWRPSDDWSVYLSGDGENLP